MARKHPAVHGSVSLCSRVRSRVIALPLRHHEIMGKKHGPYEADYPEGSVVKIAPRSELERFMREWKWHNKLQSEQLEYAGQEAIVGSVGFYHGGDELYTLDGIPGVWHEECLTLS